MVYVNISYTDVTERFFILDNLFYYHQESLIHKSSHLQQSLYQNLEDHQYDYIMLQVNLPHNESDP